MSNEYLAQEQLDIICLHSFNNIGRIFNYLYLLKNESKRIRK